MTERILVDANSVSHAGHQGTVLKAGDQETQAILAVVKFARAIRVKNPAAQIIYLWDGKSWRKDLSEAYKSNRTDTPAKVEDRRRFKTQAPFIRKALTLMGQTQMFAINLDADDLAGILVPKFLAKGEKVQLITGDQDWLQLVSPGVTWSDHRKEDRFVTHKSFTDYTGYPTVEQFVQSKALKGDTSDHLPGVGKIGEVGAKDLLEVWGNVSWFLADTDRAATYLAKREKKMPKAFTDFAALTERQEIFYLNMRMMNLLGELPAPEKLTLSKGKFDREGFKSLCHELAFQAITRPNVFDAWVAPLEGNV